MLLSRFTGFALFGAIHNAKWVIVRDGNECHLQDLLRADFSHTREDNLAHIDAL